MPSNKKSGSFNKQREIEKEVHIITSPGLLFCFQSYDLLQSGCEMSFE